MDTHRLPKTKNILRPPMQQPSNAHPPLHAQGTGQGKPTTSKKQNPTQGAKNKPKAVQRDGRGPSSNENCQDASLLYLEEGPSADSDFEFSAEIMEHNPRQESRQCRQKGKLCHLTIYDWMMKVSTLLKLSKQCFYRGIIIMKKFMFLDQKSPTYKVNLSNVNIYGLAALLISSKFENINGNFLANISHIADSNSGQIDKHCILECEIYIMSTMRFQIANCSIVVESIMAVLDAWKEATFHTALEIFAFSRFEELGNEDESTIKDSKNQKNSLLEKYIYLVDFIMMRKLVEMRVKDIKSVDNQVFFRKIVVNVLLHLISYLIGKSPQQIQFQQLKSYRKVIHLLAAKLQIPRQQQPALQRKSHILSKQIRLIFVKSSAKSENFGRITKMHDEMANSYCFCQVRSLSTKYVPFQSLQQQAKTTFPPGLSKREDEYDTDPFPSSVIESESKQLVPNRLGFDLREPVSHKWHSRFCKNCVKSVGLLRGVVNQQFYVSLLVSDS